jgi:hypothetical protein
VRSRHLLVFPRPVIRITPDEVYIRDGQFFKFVYTGNPNNGKPGWDDKLRTVTTTFATPEGALHRKRRAAISLRQVSVVHIRFSDIYELL